MSVMSNRTVSFNDQNLARPSIVRSAATNHVARLPANAKDQGTKSSLKKVSSLIKRVTLRRSKLQTSSSSMFSMFSSSNSSLTAPDNNALRVYLNPTTSELSSSSTIALDKPSVKKGTNFTSNTSRFSSLQSTPYSEASTAGLSRSYLDSSSSSNSSAVTTPLSFSSHSKLLFASSNADLMMNLLPSTPEEEIKEPPVPLYSRFSSISSTLLDAENCPPAPPCTPAQGPLLLPTLLDTLVPPVRTVLHYEPETTVVDPDYFAELTAKPERATSKVSGGSMWVPPFWDNNALAPFGTAPPNTNNFSTPNLDARTMLDYLPEVSESYPSPAEAPPVLDSMIQGSLSLPCDWLGIVFICICCQFPSIDLYPLIATSGGSNAGKANTSLELRMIQERINRVQAVAPVAGIIAGLAAIYFVLS